MSAAMSLCDGPLELPRVAHVEGVEDLQVEAPREEVLRGDVQNPPDLFAAEAQCFD